MIARRPASLSGLLLLLLFLPAGLGAEPMSITLPAEQSSLAPGPGADLAERSCRICHSLDYITGQPRGPRAQWQGVVTKMITVYGAPVSASDAGAIVDYLARAYGLP